MKRKSFRCPLLWNICLNGPSIFLFHGVLYSFEPVLYKLQIHTFYQLHVTNIFPHLSPWGQSFHILFLFVLIYLLFNWRIISLQTFLVFCQTSTWISHSYTHISPLFWASLMSLPSPTHLSRLIQGPCLSFLRHTANACWLSILHMVMWVSMLLFPYILPSPPLSPCPQVYFLCLFCHCCPVNNFFSIIFLDSMYMH